MEMNGKRSTRNKKEELALGDKQPEEALNQDHEDYGDDEFAEGYERDGIGLPDLQRRLEETKKEREYRFHDTERQKIELRKAIENRFEVDSQFLKDQLAADRDALKETIVKELQSKKRRIISPPLTRERIKTRSNARKPVRKFPMCPRDLLWGNASGYSPLIRRRFHSDKLNDRMKDFVVLSDAQAEQDIAAMQQPYRANPHKRQRLNPNSDPLPSSVHVVDQKLFCYGGEYKVGDHICVNHVEKQYKAQIESITRSEIKLRKSTGGHTRIWAMHLKTRKTTIRLDHGAVDGQYNSSSCL